MRLGVWLAAATAITLSGCDFAPKYAPPSMELPAHFKDVGRGVAALPGNGEWWGAFRDRKLNELEAQVDAANPDIAAAVAAYDRSRALISAAEAGLLPEVDAAGDLSSNKQSAHRPLRSADQPTYYGANQIDMQVSYEVDLWGRVRDLVKAAKADAQADRDALEATRLSLHGELARAYINLRGLDSESKLYADTIAIYRQAFDLTKSRLEAKIASPIDVDRAQTQLSSAEAQAADLGLRRANLEDAVAALVGKAAPGFAAPIAASPIALPRRPRGVPAEILVRRPDVAEQERLTAAASERIGVRTADFYPRFTLNLIGGTQDTGVRLFDPANAFGSIGPSVSVPLLDWGLRQSYLEAAQAAFREAAANYRASVLRAVREVQDALSGLSWLDRETRATETAAAAARRAAGMSLVLYRDGAASYLDVVTAQNAALDAERQAIELHTRELEVTVDLMLALGGGWTVDALTAAN